jgi:DNA polymerase III epsilon subunit-like protein
MSPRPALLLIGHGSRSAAGVDEYWQFADVLRSEANGLEIKPAMEALRDWAKKTAGKSRRVFVGHNAPFDWSFVAYYFAYVGMENPFGYNALDTKALAMGKLDLGWLETSKENLQRLLPLPPQEEGQVHNALYDARYQAMILAALLNLPKRTDLAK